MKKIIAIFLSLIFAFTMCVSAKEETEKTEPKEVKRIEEVDNEVVKEKTEQDYQELNYENHKNDVAVFYDTDQSQCKHEHMEYDNYMSYEGEWYVGVSEYCPSCGYFNDNYNNSKHILEEPATEEDATEEGESNV